GIVLAHSATVQCDGRDSDVYCTTGGFDVSKVFFINAPAHFDGDRNMSAFSLSNRTGHDCDEEVYLPRQSRATTIAGDVRNWTAEVQVHMVGTVLFNQNPDCLARVHRVHRV